jgi:hypothetical protein
MKNFTDYFNNINESTINDDIYSNLTDNSKYDELKSNLSIIIDNYKDSVSDLYDEGNTDHVKTLDLVIQEAFNKIMK